MAKYDQLLNKQYSVSLKFMKKKLDFIDDEYTVSKCGY